MKHRKKVQRYKGTKKQEEQKHRNKETSEQRDQGTKKHKYRNKEAGRPPLPTKYQKHLS